MDNQKTGVNSYHSAYIQRQMYTFVGLKSPSKMKSSYLFVHVRHSLYRSTDFAGTYDETDSLEEMRTVQRWQGQDRPPVRAIIVPPLNCF